MNLNFQEAEELFDSIMELYGDEDSDNPQMIICPPSPYLEVGTDLTDEMSMPNHYDSVALLTKLNAMTTKRSTLFTEFNSFPVIRFPQRRDRSNGHVL